MRRVKHVIGIRKVAIFQTGGSLVGVKGDKINFGAYQPWELHPDIAPTRPEEKGSGKGIKPPKLKDPKLITGLTGYSEIMNDELNNYLNKINQEAVSGASDYDTSVKYNNYLAMHSKAKTASEKAAIGVKETLSNLGENMSLTMSDGLFLKNSEGDIYFGKYTDDFDPEDVANMSDFELWANKRGTDAEKVNDFLSKTKTLNNRKTIVADIKSNAPGDYDEMREKLTKNNRIKFGFNSNGNFIIDLKKGQKIGSSLNELLTTQNNVITKTNQLGVLSNAEKLWEGFNEKKGYFLRMASLKKNSLLADNVISHDKEYKKSGMSDEMIKYAELTSLDNQENRRLNQKQRQELNALDNKYDSFYNGYMEANLGNVNKPAMLEALIDGQAQGEFIDLVFGLNEKGDIKFSLTKDKESDDGGDDKDKIDFGIPTKPSTKNYDSQESLARKLDSKLDPNTLYSYSNAMKLKGQELKDFLKTPKGLKLGLDPNQDIKLQIIQKISNGNEGLKDELIKINDFPKFVSNIPAYNSIINRDTRELTALAGDKNYGGTAIPGEGNKNNWYNIADIGSTSQLISEDEPVNGNDILMSSEHFIQEKDFVDKQGKFLSKNDDFKLRRLGINLKSARDIDKSILTKLDEGKDKEFIKSKAAYFGAITEYMGMNRTSGIGDALTISNAAKTIEHCTGYSKQKASRIAKELYQSTSNTSVSKNAAEQTKLSEVGKVSSLNDYVYRELTKDEFVKMAKRKDDFGGRVPTIIDPENDDNFRKYYREKFIQSQSPDSKISMDEVFEEFIDIDDNLYKDKVGEKVNNIDPTYFNLWFEETPSIWIKDIAKYVMFEEQARSSSGTDKEQISSLSEEGRKIDKKFKHKVGYDYLYDEFISKYDCSDLGY